MADVTCLASGCPVNEYCAPGQWRCVSCSVPCQNIDNWECHTFCKDFIYEYYDALYDVYHAEESYPAEDFPATYRPVPKNTTQDDLGQNGKNSLFNGITMMHLLYIILGVALLCTLIYIVWRICVMIAYRRSLRSEEHRQTSNSTTSANISGEDSRLIYETETSPVKKKPSEKIIILDHATCSPGIILPDIVITSGKPPEISIV